MPPEPSNLKPLLLIDGDQYVYKASAAVEKEVKWDHENHVLASSLVEALEVCRGLLNRTFQELGSDRCRLAFTGPNNFRKRVSATYKGLRTTSRKPLCYGAVREAISKDYPSLLIEGLEADDLMGIWATRDPSEDTIIVSDDKDMKTIPGRLYRQGEVRTVTEAEADHWWLTQALTGDQVDGFPGCPGIGPARALSILGPANQPLSELWPLVVKAFSKAGLTADDALVQARLSRILRNEDWDSQNKEVRLWQPA